ncbi:MAG TPA: DUF3619 family protein [Casimicrobiaceae bacterium]|jgi:hypothetical protein|nr:DUF3619 family protein [Casimicrobiaceae bacterium]
MTEPEIARKLTAYLDHGAASIKAGTLYRLQLARQAALARLDEPKHASQLVFAGAGGTLGPRRGLADLRIWLGVLLVVGGIASFQYWQSTQQARDLEDTDAAILSSDLPIEAYLDRGFQAWLKHSEP